MLTHLKLRSKLLLFWLGSVVASLLALWLMFQFLVTSLHEDQARQRIELGFKTLQVNLSKRTEQLLKNVQHLAQRPDLVASVNMLTKYQDPEHYEPDVFDAEKIKLARELSERGLVDDLDALIIYDGAKRISAFAMHGDNNQQRTGYLTYRQDQEAVMLSDPAEGLFAETPSLPGLIETGHALSISSSPYSHLHTEDGRLELEIYVPILRRSADGARTPIGLIKVVDILGEAFIQALAQQANLEFMLSPAEGVRIGGLGNIDVHTWPDIAAVDSTTQDSAPWQWIEHPDYFLGALRYPVDGGQVLFASAIEKTQLEGALRAFQQSMLLALVLGGALFIPIGAYVLNRAVSGPISILVSRIEDLKRGRYRPARKASRSDELGYLLDAFHDMTQVIRARETELSKLSQAVEQSPSSVMITDTDGAIEYVNPRFTHVTGYTLEEVRGMNPRLLKSDHTPPEVFDDMWQTIATGQDWRGVLENVKKNGEAYWESVSISPIKTPDGAITHFVAVKEDITERRRAQERIEHQAHYDALTDLPNRRLLLERLEQELTRAQRRWQLGALLYIDLDHFKVINDSLGHKVGDALVMHVAHCLQDIASDGHTVARLGGDEFAILLTELSSGGDQEAALKEVQRVVDAIQATLAEPCHIDPHELYITASIGITLFPEDNESADDILRQADIAMSRAKEHGRNNFQFYVIGMQQAVSERHTLEKDLRLALHEGHLELYFQPQITCQQQLIGAECLLRWKHPEQGMISPARFIPVAEDSGLILEIGRWVLQTACAQLKHWQNDPHGPALKRLAVNISPKQFYQADFVAQVRDILAETGADPNTLELELTEGMLISNIEDAIDKMQTLQRIGVHFSIDDFGTGYSSLSYLKRLPVDKLKIDQSFVHDITTDANDAAIVDTIIAMARHLGLEVIAEGVESKLQLDFLKERGCDTYQGFYFSRALPLDEFMQFVEHRS